MLRFQGEKAKKGKEDRGNLRRAQHSKIGEKMKRKKRKRIHQGCDVAKVIDKFEQAVTTAKKVYRVIEPVVKAFTNRPKTK